jgi:putative membrane protein
MVRLLLRLAVNVAALWVAAEALDGVRYDELSTLVLAALVLGLVNFAVKPLATLLALPLIIVTLGVAYFFVSLGMLLLTSALVSGFQIDGFWNAVGATIIVWLVNAILGGLTRGDRGERARRSRRRDRPRESGWA